MIEEEYIQFSGGNWKDVVMFVGEGSYCIRYDVDGEFIGEYIYSDEIDVNIVPTDYAVKIDGKLDIWSENDWKEYNMPTEVLEFERLANILLSKVKTGVNVFEMLNTMNIGLDIRYIGETLNGYYLDNIYSINGFTVKIERVYRDDKKSGRGTYKVTYNG